MSILNQKTVTTRFAPSPTGFLHIGGVRTAIFNYLWAKHNSGCFKLRIEDTDRKRSTTEAVAAIIEGLDWMHIKPGTEVWLQTSRERRHRQEIQRLLEAGKAYRCYMTPEELSMEREAAQAEGCQFKYDRRWRDRDQKEAPEGISPSIRFKMPLTGTTRIHDRVQGSICVDNSELDDLIIQRSDGSPTYNLAVVVDDYDMGVTCIIRGDDHLNNAFRQYQIYKGLGWDVPEQAHIPLIHGPDGSKMSKRHGALGVSSYRDMGFLQPAIFNYLLRLGWSHGDQEFFSVEEAVALFDIKNINKAPSRFDMDKLRHINQYYMKETDPEDLLDLVLPFCDEQPDEAGKERFLRGVGELVTRVSVLGELAQAGKIYFSVYPETFDAKAQELIRKADPGLMQQVVEQLFQLESWQEGTIEGALKNMARQHTVKMGSLFMPLRAALAGTMDAPSVAAIAVALGRELCLKRLRKAFNI